MKRRLFTFTPEGPLNPLASFYAVLFNVMYQNLLTGVLRDDLVQCRYSCVQLPEWFFPQVSRNAEPGDTMRLDLIGFTINSLAVAASAALVLHAANGLSHRPLFVKHRRLFIVIAFAVGGTVAGFARHFVVGLIAPVVGLSSSLATAPRYFILLLLVHLLFSAAISKYQHALVDAQTQMTRADTAVAELRQQQALVVAADERVRREIASFLHDRIQAGLLVAGMKIRSVKPATESDAAILDEAIKDLERMRSEDVRGVSRRLSPDLTAVGLDTALAELAASWKPAMLPRIHFDTHAREVLHGRGVNATTATAVYRIVEQALLNSAAHGHAQHAEVDVTVKDGHVVLSVTDDGSGLPETTAPGAGSAVINAWIASVHGSWEFAVRRPATLVARIPLT